MSIQLGSSIVTPDSAPYIIAEIGVNHEGSMDRAIRLIDLAKQGGAHAAKFQSYKADTLASRHSPSYWDTKKEPTSSQHMLFQKYDSFTPRDYNELAEYCRSIEIDFVSTPFDDLAIDFLEPLVPFYKIASADITTVPLLRRIGRKGKPVVLSTGAATLAEIEMAIDVLGEAGCKGIVLQHCILNYPTDNVNAHLKMISGLKEQFASHLIGYSDHTLPDEHMTSLATAFLLGAVVIEKHFTDNKRAPGNDHYHAMDVDDLSRFVAIIGTVRQLTGSRRVKEPIPGEEISRENARRSIVLKNAVDEGHVLEEADLIYKRPGTGISPLYWDQVIGKRIARRLEADHILDWQDLSEA